MCASVMVCPGRVVWRRVGYSSLISPPQPPLFTHCTATLSSPPPPTRHRLDKLSSLTFLPLSGKRSFEVEESGFSVEFKGLNISHDVCCRSMRVGYRRGGDYPG